MQTAVNTKLNESVRVGEAGPPIRDPPPLPPTPRDLIWKTGRHLLNQA